jgi:F-type H+-transporting ATPase subunit delta
VVAVSAVAENYAEALFELGQEAGELERYGELLEATAAAVGSSSTAQAVLMNPKIPKAAKADFLGRTVTAVGAPREFVLYLAAVVKRGRQGILSSIAAAYLDLLDRHFGRVRATVTVARAADAELTRAIAARLSGNLGKEVVPTIQIDPALLGGVIVRVGDRIHDGSLKRRLQRLRRQLLGK